MSQVSSRSESITKASTEDLEKIKDLLRSSDLTLAGIKETEFWIVPHTLTRLPTACVGLETHGRDGLLRSLAVKKEYQKSGIGRSLVLFIIQAAKERKLRSLYLLTTTARDFFPRFGFIPIARASVENEPVSRSSEFEACSESSTLMKLEISQ